MVISKHGKIGVDQFETPSGLNKTITSEGKRSVLVPIIIFYCVHFGLCGHILTQGDQGIATDKTKTRGAGGKGKR